MPLLRLCGRSKGLAACFSVAVVLLLVLRAIGMTL